MFQPTHYVRPVWNSAVSGYVVSSATKKGLAGINGPTRQEFNRNVSNAFPAGTKLIVNYDDQPAVLECGLNS